MTTTKPPVDEPMQTADEIENHEDDLEPFDWDRNEDKPQTGEELYRALQESGFIGGMRDRDAVREQEMSVTKPDTAHAQIGDEIEVREDDDEDWSDLDWGFGEEKRPLTTTELLNSGLVGLWKDRTDIGDTLEFVRELRERRRTQTWHRE